MTQPATTPVTVRSITADEARETLLEVGGSFLQTPSWAATKPDWRADHLGWFDSAGQRVGAGLVLSRTIPRLKHSFVYLPEGPGLPWPAVAEDPGAWLDPLVAWARDRKAFALRVGMPLTSRVWSPETVKSQVSGGGVLSFTELPPKTDNPVARSIESWLDARSWRPIGWDTTAAVGQPRYLCIVDLDGRDRADLLKGMNQQWRRNIKKADKAGVQVRAVGVQGLDTFYALYAETGARDKFYPRPKFYVERMLRNFTTGDERLQARFYEAHVDGDVLASALMIRFGRTWSYIYGGSSERNREARASNALQWQAMQDALEAGCAAYDFRGFNTSLGATAPLTGLLLYKLGAGADVVENIGERELVINRFWHKAFDAAMALRTTINKRKRGTNRAEEEQAEV